jgi:hypothetical protein
MFCAHNECFAKVHQTCQWARLERSQLPIDVRSPVYCPAHNIQRGDYIRQYYKSRRRTIPPDILKGLARSISVTGMR